VKGKGETWSDAAGDGSGSSTTKSRGTEKWLLRPVRGLKTLMLTAREGEGK